MQLNTIIESNRTEIFINRFNSQQKENYLDNIGEVFKKVINSTNTVKELKEHLVKLNFITNYLRLNRVNKNIKQEQSLKELSIKIRIVAENNQIKLYRPFRQRFKEAVWKISTLISKTRDIEKLSGETRRTCILSSQNWLEFFDPLHRDPRALSKIFKDWKWLEYYKKRSFQEFLNRKSTLKVFEEELKCSQVIYLEKEELKNYRVSFAMENGKIVVKNCAGKILEAQLITVLGPDNQCYAGVKRRGAFQHSSFFQGKSVRSAGVFIIRNGYLKGFCNSSGHYRPQKEEVFKMLHFLEKQELDISQLYCKIENNETFEFNDEPLIFKNPKRWKEYRAFLQK